MTNRKTKAKAKALARFPPQRTQNVRRGPRLNARYPTLSSFSTPANKLAGDPGSEAEGGAPGVVVTRGEIQGSFDCASRSDASLRMTAEESPSGAGGEEGFEGCDGGGRLGVLGGEGEVANLAAGARGLAVVVARDGGEPRGLCAREHRPDAVEHHRGA